MPTVPGWLRHGNPPSMGALRIGDVSEPCPAHQIPVIAGLCMSGAKARGQADFFRHATIISPEKTYACSPGVMTRVPKPKSFSWQTLGRESGARANKKQ